jgi:hypothetical protein
VDDDATIRLATVAVNVFIQNHMLADSELTAASILFKRAANIIARVEDAIIFRGRRAAATPPIPGADALPQVFAVSGADRRGATLNPPLKTALRRRRNSRPARPSQAPHSQRVGKAFDLSPTPARTAPPAKTKIARRTDLN